MDGIEWQKRNVRRLRSHKNVKPGEPKLYLITVTRQINKQFMERVKQRSNTCHAGYVLSAYKCHKQIVP